MDKLKELKRNFVYKYHPYKFLGESHGGPIQFEKDLNELLSEYARQEYRRGWEAAMKQRYSSSDNTAYDLDKNGGHSGD